MSAASLLGASWTPAPAFCRLCFLVAVGEEILAATAASAAPRALPFAGAAVAAAAGAGAASCGRDSLLRGLLPCLGAEDSCWAGGAGCTSAAGGSGARCGACWAPHGCRCGASSAAWCRWRLSWYTASRFFPLTPSAAPAFRHSGQLAFEQAGEAMRVAATLRFRNSRQQRHLQGAPRAKSESARSWRVRGSRAGCPPGRPSDSSGWKAPRLQSMHASGVVFLLPGCPPERSRRHGMLRHQERSSGHRCPENSGTAERKGAPRHHRRPPRLQPQVSTEHLRSRHGSARVCPALVQQGDGREAP